MELEKGDMVWGIFSCEFPETGTVKEVTSERVLVSVDVSSIETRTYERKPFEVYKDKEKAYQNLIY